MKKLVFSTLIIFMVILFPSCFGETNPTEVQEELTQYPLSVGNIWQYEQEGKYINIRPDSLIGHLPGTILKNSTIVSIPRRQTLLGTIETYVIREEFFWGGSLELSGEHYYDNQSDGFYLHAYKGLITILPKNSPLSLGFKNKAYQGINEILMEFDISWRYPTNSAADSIIMEIPPLMILPYPLEIGQSWIYREEANQLKIVKKVVTSETINISAGQFTVKVVQWFYDLNNNGIWDEDIIILDYYSSIGLVKRSITFKNMELYNQYNQLMGYVDYSEISELQSYTVK